jgi:energy-coupling factor transporter ATP-binding protein EcfA2
MSIKTVIDWVNADGKPLWWRSAVKLILEHGTLNEQQKVELHEIAKTEHLINPSDPLFSSKTLPVSDTGYTVENDPIRLLGISNVSNVASLVQNKSLTFEPLSNLTIVYGNNGSGKSSYAKILKNACLTRGQVPDVISNVYANSVGIPSSDINIQVGNNEVQTATWIKGHESSAELKSIRIFDSNSANHFLSKEDNIEYKPASLKILDELIVVCNVVANNSTKDIQGLGQQAIFPILSVGSVTAQFLQSVNKNTTKEKLEQHCVTPVEIDSLIQLRKNVADLQLNSPQDLRKKYREHYQRLDPLIKHFDDLLKSLDNSAIQAVSTQFETMKTTEAAAEASRKSTLDGLPIDGIASPAWQLMWQHVEQFIMQNGQGNSFPPIEGEYCPTCIQPITESSAAKLQLFNDYLKDKTQNEANKARIAFDQTKVKLKRLSFELTAHGGVLKWIEDFNSKISINLNTLNDDLKIRYNTAAGTQPIFQFAELTINGLEWLKQQSATFKQNELDVKDNATKIATIKTLETQILEIENRSKITDNKALIQAEILRLKKLDLLNNLAKSTKITKITSKVKEIAAQGSVGKLQETFLKELEKLNFQYLKVETVTRGKAGQSMLQLKLSNTNTKIPDIASEGEQKCIALAGFLAELIVDNRKSAVVFDDPVNSLDHLWREKFANRIVEETQVRQVIVLTHDLPFLKLLEDTANQHQTQVNICAIRRHGSEAGYPMDEPPWEAFNTNKRVKKLKNLLPELKKQFNNSDQQLYVSSAKSFYDQMRKTWERLVEEWLFRGVVERFNLGIKTQNLKYIDTIDANDNKIISEAMAKCSKHVHDTASALGVSFPDFDEVESDFTGLENYFKVLKNRRETDLRGAGSEVSPRIIELT